MALTELYDLGYSSTFDIVGREEVTQNLNLTVNPLASSGTLTGTVTSGGSGLDGATVKVYDVNDNPVEHTNTGGIGQYTIANLPVGSYKVTAIKDGYLLPLTTPFTIQQNKSTTVNINLTQDPDASLSVIYGIIRTTIDETPLENAVVSLYSIADPQEPELIISSTTNDRGQYIFGLIPAGDYYVTATKLGFYTNQSADINVGTNEFIDSNISLIADALANTATISGFIKDTAGNPIADAGVALYLINNGVETVVDTTRTNVSGKYLFSNVNPGNYLVKSTKQVEVV